MSHWAGDPQSGAELRCPRCDLPHSQPERLCRGCGMPLVVSSAEVTAGEPEPDRGERAGGSIHWRSETRSTARKIRPQLARGELVRVTGAQNLAEAELIQGMLLEQGVPSILRRTRGFDVPDFLAAGPRDVLVAESGYERAEELLSDADMLSTPAEPGAMPGIGSPGRLAVGVAAAAVLAFAIVWIAYQLAF